MAITITSTLLNGLRTYITDMAAYGRYMIDGTWHRAELNSASVQANGAVHITYYIERQSGNLPATKFQVLDSQDQVLAERTEDVYFQQYMDRVLIRFKLGVSVGT